LIDRYSEPGNVLLQDFDGMERNFEGTDFEHVSKWMPEKGYSFDFFRMDRNQLPWKIFYNTNMPARRRENARNGLFDASSWKPLPPGLLGPVTLTGIFYE